MNEETPVLIGPLSHVSRQSSSVSLLVCRLRARSPLVMILENKSILEKKDKMAAGCATFKVNSETFTRTKRTHFLGTKRLEPVNTQSANDMTSK